jgi:hypothetical protein
MKTFFLILFLLIMLGCHSEHKVKIGAYKSITYNKFDLAILHFLKGLSGAFIGSEVTLKNDSSFTYTTCGSSMIGFWQCKNDSLLLYVKSNKFRIDSLNVIGLTGHFPTIPKNPIKFYIENEYLIRIHKINAGKKNIEKLKFKVPK